MTMEHAHTPESGPEAVEALANQISDTLAELLEDGHHPHRLAEASLIAALPLLIEVTKAPTIEACLKSLAARFDGNELRAATPNQAKAAEAVRKAHLNDERSLMQFIATSIAGHLQQLLDAGENPGHVADAAIAAGVAMRMDVSGPLAVSQQLTGLAKQAAMNAVADWARRDAAQQPRKKLN